MRRPAAMAGVVLLALTWGSVAKGDGSFSNLDIEFSEAKVTLQTVVAENELLKGQLKEAQEALKSLTGSLAIANGEAEVFRREAAELKLRMEALGVDGLSADQTKREQRLLKAVRDLQLLQAEKDDLSAELIGLLEVILRYTQSVTGEDPEARAALEGQLRSATTALGLPGSERAGEGATPVDLSKGQIVSMKEELSLVVANIGSLQGVRVGMPFRVVRDGTEIGTVRVVDVREKICGAVIQSLDFEKNKIKVGDRLRVDAR
ncbi:MAG TPA: hypothetical protein VNQ90_02465 [Chthoniobacteraceae bacterium]|nr:hypothetical protein [Chthoniobacteraceae bacterium]